MTKIGIASDHAGYEMKEFLVGYLSAMGYDVHDFGPGSPESVDYADYAHPLAEAVEKGEFECGIALCGSGEGSKADATSTVSRRWPYPAALRLKNSRSGDACDQKRMRAEQMRCRHGQPDIEPANAVITSAQDRATPTTKR